MDILIKKSKINGKGIFANKDFKKGEVIIKWNPSELTEDKVNKSTKKYLIKIKGKIFLMSSPERYMNHSCEPNAYEDTNNFQDIALRNIKKGEEITVDYGKNNYGDKMKCNCKSKDCRKYI
ncbi:MAG: SET domain-containing protein [Nanoarchaeota archaeon]